MTFTGSFMSEKNPNIFYNEPLLYKPSCFIVSISKMNLILIKCNCKKVKVQLCCTPADLDPLLLTTSELPYAADQTGQAGSLWLFRHVFSLTVPPELWRKRLLQGGVQHAAEHGLIISACSSGKKHLCYSCIRRLQPDWLNQSFSVLAGSDMSTQTSILLKMRVTLTSEIHNEPLGD